jgi:hypothetical protein
LFILVCFGPWDLEPQHNTTQFKLFLLWAILEQTLIFVSLDTNIREMVGHGHEHGREHAKATSNAKLGLANVRFTDIEFTEVRFIDSHRQGLQRPVSQSLYY